MGFFVFFCSRIVPLLVIGLALILGYLSQQELPYGIVFATVFPLMKGHIPPTIIGHGKMKGTVAVPEDMLPSPRPENEMFLELPGGYMMPQNGLGMCCRYSAYDDILVRRTVLWYLLLGGRHIDGAHIYLNHKAIGQGISDAMKRGIPREEIFVTTKVFPSHFGYELTKSTVPKYLEELNLEYIDLVLIHFPVSLSLMTNGCTKKGLSNEACRQETWKALSEIRSEGLVRNIGVSNFAVNHIKQIEELDLAPVAVNQIQYNPWAPDHTVDTFQYCQKQNIAVTAYASLGGSLQHSQALTVQTLEGIAQAHNKSIAQIMLRWSLQTNAVVIPGTGNPKHMKENLEVYGFELSEEEMISINKLKSDEGAKKFFYMDPVD